MNEIINEYLNKKRNKTKYLIENIFDMETSYLFTNDDNYLKYYIYNKTKWSEEMRKRIEAYFKLK